MIFHMVVFTNKSTPLEGVQNLIKKHEAVEAEITTHEQLIHAVISTADELIERQHYATDEIETRCAELQEKWAELTSLSSKRQQKLKDSLQAQLVRSALYFHLGRCLIVVSKTRTLDLRRYLLRKFKTFFAYIVVYAFSCGVFI